MKATVTLVLALLSLGVAGASEVFRSTDDKGQPVYTDKPEVLPAEKMNINTRSTDTLEVQRRYEEDMKRYSASDAVSRQATAKATDAQKARDLSAEDRAKRCTEARARHEAYQTAQRMYEPGATENDRRYLSDEEIEVAKANARKVMDEACSGL